MPSQQLLCRAVPVAGCGGTVSRVYELGRTHASDDGMSELSVLEACNVFSLVSASSTPCDCSVSLHGLRVCDQAASARLSATVTIWTSARRHLTLSIPSQVCSVSLTLSADLNDFSSSCSSCALDICMQCEIHQHASSCASIHPADATHWDLVLVRIGSAILAIRTRWCHRVSLVRLQRQRDCSSDRRSSSCPFGAFTRRASCRRGRLHGVLGGRQQGPSRLARL